jgi:excisionase family DNA binding protein
MATEQTGAADALRFVTVPAAAREIGVGVDQLRRAVRNGALATYAIGGWPRLERSELIAWARSQRRASVQQ